jgi:hypothetical protein
MAFVSPDYAASDAPFRLAYAPLEHFTRNNSGIRTASAVAKEAVARTEDGKKCWSGEVPKRGAF